MRLLDTLWTGYRCVRGAVTGRPVAVGTEFQALCAGCAVPGSCPAALPPRPRRRLPIALARVLGADCSLCRGIGCESCAHTGFR